jgi:hypothetical protein
LPPIDSGISTPEKRKIIPLRQTKAQSVEQPWHRTDQTFQARRPTLRKDNPTFPVHRQFRSSTVTDQIRPHGLSIVARIARSASFPRYSDNSKKKPASKK